MPKVRIPVTVLGSALLLLLGGCPFDSCSDDEGGFEPYDEIPTYGGKVDGLIAVTPDGNVAVTSSNTEDPLYVTWQNSGDSQKIAHGIPDENVAGLALLPDASYLVSVHGTWKPSTLKLWKLPEGTEAGRLRLDDGSSWDPAVSSDGRLLATGGLEGQVRLFELPQLREVANFSQRSSPISGIDFSPDGTRLAVCDHAGWLYVWDVESHKELHAEQLARQQGAGNALREVRFSQQGSLLGVYDFQDSRKLLVLDAGSFEVKKRLDIAQGPFDFSPDGHQVAVGGDTSATLIGIYDLETGERLQSLGVPSGGPIRTITIGLRSVWLRYLDDGRIMSKDNEGQIRVWGREE